jgi:hypothetical protein
MAMLADSHLSRESKVDKVHIADFCQKLHAAMSARSNLNDQVATCAKALSSTFRVQPDAVACFKFDPDLDSFSFLWPPEMKESGSIPLSAHRLLLVRTAEEKKAFLDNLGQRDRRELWIAARAPTLGDFCPPWRPC